jgi:acyl-coenzyme A thioesterase PaaI-like protein
MRFRDKIVWVTGASAGIGEAEVIHVGGRTATAADRIEDERGKLYAHGTTTCIIFRP